MQESFSEYVKRNAENILEILKSSSPINSWDIKLKLKLSSSQLYLALGYLISTNKITIYPEELTYKVKLNNQEQ